MSDEDLNERMDAMIEQSFDVLRDVGKWLEERNIPPGVAIIAFGRFISIYHSKLPNAKLLQMITYAAMEADLDQLMGKKGNLFEHSNEGGKVQ